MDPEHVVSTPCNAAGAQTVLYKDEVVGRDVEILRNQCWAPGGKICRVLMELPSGDGDGTGRNLNLIIRHYVKASNGGGYWLDLSKALKDGHIRMLSQTTTAAVSAPQVKKRKTEAERRKQLKKDNGGQEEKIPYPAESMLSNGFTMTDTLSRFVPETEPKFGQLESGERVVHEDESSHTSDLKTVPSKAIVIPDPLPSSITAIIRYMDELEPDQNYYERQADSRGECSGTRGKLRKFARAEANKNHKATKHYRETKNWQPPDEETLFALIALIKTMIK